MTSELHIIREWVGPYKTLDDLLNVYVFPPKENSACKLSGESHDGIIVHAVNLKGLRQGQWARISMVVVNSNTYTAYADDRGTMSLIST